jgi:MFS family permease
VIFLLKQTGKTMHTPTQDQPLSKQLYPWLIWLLSAGFLFYKYLLEVSPSVMANELMNEFSIHGAQLGNLASFYFYAYLLMQIPAGILIDKYGPRKLTALALFFCALGSLALSHSTNFYLACFGRFLSGAGAAFAVISCLKLITIWFPKNRFAFMAGLMMTAGMLGAVTGQAPLAASVNHWGWRDALTGVAIFGMVYSIVYYLIIRDKRPNAVNSNTDTPPLPIIKSITYMARKPQNWLLSLYSGLAFAPVAVLGGLWGVPFLHEAYGLSKPLAASDISMLFVGFAVGAPLFGLWSDSIGKRKPLVYLGTLFAILFISLLVYLPTIPIYFISLLLFGFGFFISAFLISFTMIRESNSLLFAATSVAIMNAFNAALCAGSDPLIGKFLDMTWNSKLDHGAPVFSVSNYHLAFSALPLYLIISLVLFFFVKETHCEQVEGGKSN